MSVLEDDLADSSARSVYRDLRCGSAKLLTMPTSTQICSLLRQGDRRTVGHVATVVETVLQKPKLLAALVHCMFEPDEGTRMRAADALEKVSRHRVEELQPYTSALLGLFEENDQQELRWHLAVILPRLHLDGNQRKRTSRVLQQCLSAKSSIVRTFALQGLSDLAAKDAALLPLALDAMREAERNGTPAMKARSRKLLAVCEKYADTDGNSSDSPAT